MVSYLLSLLCCLSLMADDTGNARVIDNKPFVSGTAVAQNNYRFYLTQVINKSKRTFKVYCRRPKNYWRSPVLTSAPTEFSVLTPAGATNLGNTNNPNPPPDRLVELYRLWQGDPNSGINNRITILENNRLLGAVTDSEKAEIHKEIDQLKKDRALVEEYLRPVIPPTTTEKMDFDYSRLQCRIFSEDDRPKTHVLLGTTPSNPDMEWHIPPTYVRTSDNGKPIEIQIYNTACTTRGDATHQRKTSCPQDMQGCPDCSFGSTLLKAESSNGKRTCLCVPNRADVLEVHLYIDADLEDPKKPGGIKLVPVSYTTPVENRPPLYQR